MKQGKYEESNPCKKEVKWVVNYELQQDTYSEKGPTMLADTWTPSPKRLTVGTHAEFHPTHFLNDDE